MSMMTALDGLPHGIDYIILDNFIKAYSIINNRFKEKIVCTVSGGSDSDIMIDICVRCDEKRIIEYVWFDTGLEYQATKDHLRDLEEKYGIEIKRFPAKTPIPTACKKYGVPFLSKRISEYIERLQRHGFKWEDKPFEELYKEYPKCKAALRWWCNDFGEGSRFNIAKHKYLKEYMIDNPPDFLISPKCCECAKKSVLKEVVRCGGYDLDIAGMRKAEDGARSTAYKTCFNPNATYGVDLYMPLWWYLDETKRIYAAVCGVEHSKCYSEYGLKRTGCAGCPFGQNFEYELKVIEQYEPKLRKAVEAIFGASYRYTRNYKIYRAFMEGQK